MSQPKYRIPDRDRTRGIDSVSRIVRNPGIEEIEKQYERSAEPVYHTAEPVYGRSAGAVYHKWFQSQRHTRGIGVRRGSDT